MKNDLMIGGRQKPGPSLDAVGDAALIRRLLDRGYLPTSWFLGHGDKLEVDPDHVEDVKRRLARFASGHSNTIMG